ncbi:MAG TPA: hypothetical protein VGL27_02510 [Negativicutes bacterium]|jgi:hypothetical protein
MCWVCNPSCGKCKPPIQIVKCPGCGVHNLADIRNCKKCRAVLPARVEQSTTMCLYSGMMCANPCNKHQEVTKDGVIMPCTWNTPPKKGSDMPAQVII